MGIIVFAINELVLLLPGWRKRPRCSTTEISGNSNAIGSTSIDTQMGNSKLYPDNDYLLLILHKVVVESIDR